MGNSIEYIVYLVGIVAFGFFIEYAKSASGGGILYLVFSVCYLFVLRFIGKTLSRNMAAKRRK